jgi:hypothetical protein
MAVATRMNVSIDHEGENVKMTFGNVTIDMHYEDALPFAHHLRLHASEAKRKCGDTSKVVTVSGLLSDAEENYRRGI